MTKSTRYVQHYVIKLVSDLRQVVGFLRILRFPPPIKLTATIYNEILLKVSLNTIKPNQTLNIKGKFADSLEFPVYIQVTK